MNNSNPKIVIYTNADAIILKPLINKGLNIIGIAEDSDKFYDRPLIIRFLVKLYWWLFKWESPMYNSYLAKVNKINYLVAGDSKSVEFQSWLKKLSPDIMLVYLTQILDVETFSIPKYGTVNLHPSLLPDYRGPHPVFCMHFYFDLNGGSTLHYIDEGIDTGEIIEQSSFLIEPGMTEDVVVELAIEKHGIEMFVQFIKNNIYLKKTGNLGNDLDINSVKPYAHRLTSDEYFECIDFENWTLEHTWHFLRCIDTWKLKFFSNKKVDDFFELSINDYKYTQTNHKSGLFVREGSKLFITHKDGVININRKFSLNRYIKFIIHQFI